MDPDIQELLSRGRQLEQELELVRRQLENRPDSAWLERPFDALWCTAGSMSFVVALLHVEEVLPNAALVRSPGSLAWQLGALNLGGKLVPIIDVAARFGEGETPGGIDASLIICSVEEKQLGILASGLPDVFTVVPDDLLPLPNDLVVGQQVLLSMVRRGARTVPLLGVLSLALRCGHFAPEEAP